MRRTKEPTPIAGAREGDLLAAGDSDCLAWRPAESSMAYVTRLVVE
jgi:hypothetical protein